MLAEYLFTSVFFALGLLGQSLSLAIDSASGAPGGAVSVNVRLGPGAAQAAGLQFTVVYPPGAIMSVVPIAGPEAALATKALTCVDAEASLKCVLVGLNSNAIRPGTVAVLNLQISAAAQEGLYTLDLDDIAAALPDGRSVTITAAGGLLSVRDDAGPVFLDTNVVNSASFVAGAVAPGELITIFGSGLGPAFGAYGSVTPEGVLANATAGVRVLFDGRPAPLIFVRSDQVNVVAPYEIAGNPITELTVEYQHRTSAIVTLPVVEASPALFTATSSGSGPGAILNEDSTVNSANNPARPGSIIALYATGVGKMTPSPATGEIVRDRLPRPSLPISANVGVAAAEVVFAAALSNAVAGVLQINIRVPENAGPGNLPVGLTVGETASPAGVTVAIGEPGHAADKAEAQERP